MNINKVFFCENCMYTLMVKGATVCPRCSGQLNEIGFVETDISFKDDTGGSVERGFCGCGKPRAIKGLDPKGRRRYRTQCNSCLVATRKIKKADTCKICGIKPEDKKQLHKDHIDGDRSNNSLHNIQTLCVECHKYKTNRQKDWRRKNGKEL